ncbi:MAG: virulence protein RhuM/Fic/DOC family protein, partial [Coprobacillus sp.]|nr:virulence protein RhuM/Fic/DOC family protein [Coprobacillus sp.]
LSLLFDRDIKTIGKHINNALKEELDSSTVAKFATVKKEGDRQVTRDIEYYNLDMIISIGYRVKSKRGVLFRKWANGILKKYLIKGYVVNDCHFQDTDFLKAYQRGFKILDDYDHHQLEVPQGQKDTYVLHYDECMKLIHNTMFDNKGDLFSIEKDDSFRSSISTIYQSFGDVDLYPTLEDKASALLYFIVKNHSFIDGNKRIGATIFLYFLNMNNALYKNGMERINNDALATLTILVASSRPEDKEIMMQLIKTILK